MQHTRCKIWYNIIAAALMVLPLSCNWVPYHRDPLSRFSLKGLRNIALNITAMPMFAIVNKSTISRYLKTGDYEYSGKIDKDYALMGYFQPNILLKAGVCVSLGRFSSFRLCFGLRYGF